MAILGAATTADREGMIALWRVAFPEDDEQDITVFLDRFLNTAYVVRDGDRVVSMAFLLSATVWTVEREYPVGYIYAGATLPAYRGQGLYRRLLEYTAQKATQKGLVALFLRPADAALERSYRRMGFTVSLITCKNDTPIGAVGSLGVTAFASKKHARLSRVNMPHIMWSAGVIAYLETYTTACLTVDGALVLSAENGVCLEYVPMGEIHAPLTAGLLRPLRDDVFDETVSLYMGYGLE